MAVKKSSVFNGLLAVILLCGCTSATTVKNDTKQPKKENTVLQSSAPSPSATVLPSSTPELQATVPTTPKPTILPKTEINTVVDTGNQTLNGLCDSVLSSIVNETMDERAKCYAIYQWTENNIHYRGGFSHDDWINGAITALNTRKGDCFAFYSVGRALLTRAGFKTKQANIGDNHYWVKVMYDGQWLNWDATTGWGTERFLWTDDQLRAYSYRAPGYNETFSYAGY